MTASEISPVPREARPFQGAPAGIVTRVVANTVDTLVVAAALAVCYGVWVSVLFLLNPQGFSFPSTTFLSFLTAAFLLATLYLWLSWWLVGRTYGDHLMGIRVTGRHRPRLGPMRALARAALCAFFPIGLFWVIVSPKRRSAQDIAVFSQVVYDWMPRPAEQGAHAAGGLDEDRPVGGADDAIAPGARPAARSRFRRRSARVAVEVADPPERTDSLDSTDA